MSYIYFSPEDGLFECIGKKLICEVSPGLQVHVIGKKEGNSYLKKNMNNYISMARHNRVLILTDLDNEVCAPSLIGKWLDGKDKPDLLCLRVAVREAESWVLADHDAMEKFAGRRIRPHLPRDSDVLRDPKKELLSLIKKYAPRKTSNDFIRFDKGEVYQGMGYNSLLDRYITTFWNPVRASERSDSLMRARDAIRNLLKRT